MPYRGASASAGALFLITCPFVARTDDGPAGHLVRGRSRPPYCISEIMPGIFINYRRDDAAGAAGRLHDYLARSFPRGDLLMDVDAIEPGFDFVKQLETQVSQCDALLALIGQHWLVAEDEQGRRRLEDERDYVRIEIASALKRGIPVIPVLLDGTPMPSQGELPDDLKSLTRRQALELRHTRFAVDADAIVSALRHRLPKKRNPWVWFLAAAGCLIVGVGLGLFFYSRSLPTLPRASVGSSAVSTPATSMSCDQEKHLRSQATTEFDRNFVRQQKPGNKAHLLAKLRRRARALCLSRIRSDCGLANVYDPSLASCE